MALALPFALRRFAFGFADTMVTLPILRWTWRGLADDAFAGELPEFRPADRDAVRDMMAGRYLLASKLVETSGTSPFGLDVDHLDWWLNLHGFAWLRHFRDVRDAGEKRFARTLVLDWITREGQFEHDSWAPALTAQRVLNWLRHLPLLLEGATPAEARTIQRMLGAQIQSSQGSRAAGQRSRRFSVRRHCPARRRALRAGRPHRRAPPCRTAQ